MYKRQGQRFASNEHLIDWLTLHSMERQDNWVQCEQHAGDIMIVPAMWAHAVVNVRDSVAVATELSDCLDAV